MTVPLLPTIPIRDGWSVLPVNLSHSPFSPPVSDTSDDGNYNPEDTLAQIQAMMIASFASLQQNINTLCTQVIALTTTNQAQTKEIQSLASTIQYLSTRTQARYLAPYLTTVQTNTPHDNHQSQLNTFIATFNRQSSSSREI